jgi:hypothetical protein
MSSNATTIMRPSAPSLSSGPPIASSPGRHRRRNRRNRLFAN